MYPVVQRQQVPSSAASVLCRLPCSFCWTVSLEVDNGFYSKNCECQTSACVGERNFEYMVTLCVLQEPSFKQPSKITAELYFAPSLQ